MKHTVPPTAKLVLKLIETSPEPIHAGTILKNAGCSINTLKSSLYLLTRLGKIERINLGLGPCYRAATVSEVARGN